MKPWAAAALYSGLTLLLAAPLLAHFGSAFPHDAADPALNEWILWWSTKHVPLTSAWWNAPMFYPATSVFAFSELLVGLLPITIPVQAATGSPLVAYNAAFLLSFPLCALAMYALAFELTRRRGAALVAGLAFAFAPYRMAQLSHLQVLAYYGAPLALVGLHRFTRTGERRWLALFGGAWLLQSLSNGYALFHVAVLIGLWILWFARTRTLALPIIAAWAIASLPLAPILLEYNAVHSALHFSRSINEIRGFGLDLTDFVTASPDLALWGRVLSLPQPERAVFPGATLLLVGLVALLGHWRRREPASGRLTVDQRVFAVVAAIAASVAGSWLAFGAWHLGPLTVNEARKPFSIAVAASLLIFLRSQWLRRVLSRHSVAAFYLVATAVMYVLALGPEPRAFSAPFLYRPPYDWLMALPGFATLRVPARFTVVAILCESVLLAIVVSRWRLTAFRERALVTLVAAGLVLDGAVRMPVAPAPTAPPPYADVDAVVELPAGELADFAAIHRATLHGLPIVNGYSGYFPHHYLPLEYALTHGHFEVLREFPAPRGMGVAVDRHSADAEALAARLAEVEGVTPGNQTADWSVFIARTAPAPLRPPGRHVQIGRVTANRMPDDVRRMTDGDVETAWHAGPTQAGDEEVLADLGSVQPTDALVISMGAFAFGFPRQLDVDVSDDGQAWSPAWSGPTDVAVVRGALAEPGTVPLRIDLGARTTRFIRLRQKGTDTVPWWIAELAVYAPLTITANR